MLQKAAISVPLGTGVDTKTADALIMPARLSRLENAIFPRPGELQKRPGFERLPATGLTRGDALARFDQELLVAGDGSLRAYTPESRAWRSRGGLRSAKVRASGVWTDQADQLYPSLASLNGVSVVAYESSAGGVYATVFDEAGGRVVSNVLVDADGDKPVCVACANHLFIFYRYTDGADYAVKYTKIATAAPSVFTAPVERVALGDLSADAPFFTVKPYLGEMLIAYCHTDTFGYVSYLNTDGTWATVADGHPNPIQFSAVLVVNYSALNVAVSGDAFMVLWVDDTDAYAAAFSQQFATLRAEGLIASGVGYGHAPNITGAPDSGYVRVYIGEPPPATEPTYNALVRTCLVPVGAGAVSDLKVLKRSVGLATEAFVLDGSPVVGVVYDSTEQGTVFFLNSGGQTVAKALAGRAGSIPSYPRLATVAEPSPKRFATVVGSKGRLVAQSGQVTYFTRTISRLDLDFSDERFRSVQLGRNLHLAGGVVSGYDGAQVFEAGFHVFPEKCSVAGQEWGITYKNGTPGAAISIDITPPPDLADVPVVHSGGRVRPGSYLILWPNDGAKNYFWFKVDGVGSDPQPFGALDPDGIHCDLLSSDTQAQVAAKLAAAINSYASAGATLKWTATITAGNKVVAVPSSAVVISATDYTYPPAAEGTFAVLAYHYGDAAAAERFVAVCPAGKWISPGQWFYAESSRRDASITTNSKRAFYFVVDGEGDAPGAQDLVQPGVDAAVTVPIPINSTDTMQQVAVAVRDAINGAQRAALPLFSAALSAANSCTVLVACVANTAGGFGTVSTHAYNHDVAAPLVAGQRLYYAMYRWTDAQGQLHRSAPSPAFTAITGAAGGGANIVGAATYRLGRRPSGAIFVDIYRTPSGGEQVPRLVASLANDATVDSVSFLDDTTDDALQSAEPAYWAGGELENIAPPPSAFVGEHGGRVWLVDEYGVLWYSKKFSDQLAVTWSDFLTMPVEKGAGEVVAVTPLDDKGIVWKTDSILWFAGDGFDDNGGGQGFTVPQPLPFDVGCVSPESLVLTKHGWVFKSRKGFCLLDRSLSVTYLGAEVEAFNAQDVTSAAVAAGSTQVRFTTSAGRSLVWDYEAKVWGANTYHARHALVWGTTYVRLTPEGLVLQETPGRYTDDGAPIRLLARTAWLKLNDVQGYGRVYKALVLGRYLSKHKLEVGIAYDYDDSTSEILAYDAGAALGGNAFGAGDFGSSDPFGGTSDGPVEQLDVRPSVQKCEAIRLEFSDLPDDSGESLALVHLQLVVGVKGPGWKSAQVVGK